MNSASAQVQRSVFVTPDVRGVSVKDRGGDTEQCGTVHWRRGDVVAGR
jgi:hypothetical protein